MKNVLIITFYFPPKPEIGGLRLFGLAKYLSLYGWNPIILTPVLPEGPDPEFLVIQTPYNDVIELWKSRFGLNPKKAISTQLQIARKRDEPSIVDRLTFIPNEIITYPDETTGWYDHAVMAGETLLKEKKIDAILSSSRPETCHLIAKTLAEKYGIPWVADFRDLWSQNHYSSFSYLKWFLLQNLEIKTLKYASAITTVSQPLAEKLGELHKNIQIFTIKNGFDPETVSTENTVDQKFTIIYTGYLYQGKRDPSQLFSVIHELCDTGVIERDDIKIHFFGYPKFESPENWLEEEIAHQGLQDLVVLHGTVTHDTAVIEQRKAQLLLLLTWNNPDDRGVYTGKLFEYLAARRPIISFGYTEGGVIKELLIQTRAGIHAGNPHDLREVIVQSYQEYKKSGRVQYRGVHAEIMKYSQKEMARNFVTVLERVLE